MVIFKKVKYKNFLSTGNTFTEINLIKSPITIVTGANGAGKSTVLDAICFGLFNKAFRNINKPLLINSINMVGLEVQIEFTVSGKDYKVIRGMKPNRFEIYENDKLVDQSAANRDYQKHLEDNILCGLNEKVFRQVVVIGSANYVPFMQLPLATRREVIEELLDIKIFSVMLLIGKEKMNILKDNIKELEYQIKLLQEKITIHKENIKKLKEEAAKKKELLQSEIAR